MRQYLLLIFTCFTLSLQLNTYAQHQTVAPGQTTGVFALPAGACARKYAWTNDHPEIGLAAFGNVTIPAFVAINTTGKDITATIRAVPAGTAYIGSPNNTEFTVIDLATFERITTVNTGKTANRQIVSPDGKHVYAVSNASNALIVINTANYSVATVDVGAPPDDLAISPDGSRVYVTSFGQGTIKVFNTADNSLITSISAPTVSSIVQSPDGTKLYAAAYNKVYEINTTTFAQTDYPLNVQSASNGMLISPDGKEIYIATVNNLCIFNTQTKTVVTFIYVEGVATDMALSKDGSTLYSTNSINKAITTIDVLARTVKFITTVTYSPTGIDLSNDGSRLYVTDGNNSVYAYNTVNNAFISRIDAGNAPTAIGSFVVPGTCEVVNYTITVTASTTAPGINIIGAPAALSTTYGVASSLTSVGISATNLSSVLQLAAPLGFELSTDRITYNRNLVIPNSNGRADVEVYIRLAANVPARNYNGTLTINATGLIERSVPIPTGVVAGAPITIVLDNVEKPYGNVLGSLATTSGFKVLAGLMNGETITGITRVYSTGAAAADKVGVYPKSVDANTPTGSNGFDAGNYIVTTQRGDIVVVKTMLKVTANNKSRVLGEDNPSLTYLITGFVNNETSAVLSKQPTITTTADITSPLGRYPIVADGAEADNYSFNYIPGTLTITTYSTAAITAPSAFTPNGDGINDTWLIKNIESAPKCTVDIFNRNGQKVFASIGYGTQWDGSYKNIHAPAGAYYYIIDPRNGGAKLSGTVIVIR
ncbi:MBG domain-containing protein [Mucilaginibacter calamicampi]|uniref:MBG domain-containing protein n=1 Tax=Mucilaginibacter calamicampi TaxID=1302352 RepID=A0ABW2YT61_9SPHI